jgi:hypothetical protein
MAAPNSQLSTPLQNLSANQAVRLLCYALNVSANAVADTVMPLIDTSKFSVLYVIVTDTTASLAQALGGVFTAPGGTGTTIVTAAALSAATDATIVVQQTVASTAVVTNVTNLYYRVTVVNTAAANFDVFCYGFSFDNLPQSP